MEQKASFEKEKKALIELAAEKEVLLKKKLGTIGNIVHDSVPENNNEVNCSCRNGYIRVILTLRTRISTPYNEHGLLKVSQLRKRTSSPTTKFSPDSMATIPNEE